MKTTMTERILRARLYLYSIVLLVFVILWSAVTNVWSAGNSAQVSNEGAAPVPTPTAVEEKQRRLAVLARREQAAIREARRATRILKQRRKRYAAAVLEQQRLNESSAPVLSAPVSSAPVYSAPVYVPPAYSPPPVAVVSTPEPTTQSGSS